MTAPAAVRGGLFFQSRVEIRARRAIAHPRLVLDEGWVEGMQFNSIEPAPVSEASRDGRVVLSYDRIDAGDRLVVWMQFEVDPPTSAIAPTASSSTTPRRRSPPSIAGMTVFP